MQRAQLRLRPVCAENAVAACDIVDHHHDTDDEQSEKHGAEDCLKAAGPNLLHHYGDVSHHPEAHSYEPQCQQHLRGDGHLLGDAHPEQCYKQRGSSYPTGDFAGHCQR